jgi:hypothetical protein
MGELIYAVGLIFALPLLMLGYAWKQYLVIRMMRGGWWKVLALLPIVPVGFSFAIFPITRILGYLGPKTTIFVGLTAGFALVVALLYLSLLSIAFGASRRDQNIPPEDRHMRRDAEIYEAVFWAVGVVSFVLFAVAFIA